MGSIDKSVGGSLDSGGSKSFQAVIVDGRRVYVQNTTPSTPEDGDVWVKTDS